VTRKLPVSLQITTDTCVRSYKLLKPVGFFDSSCTWVVRTKVYKTYVLYTFVESYVTKTLRTYNPSLGH